jgi:uncharacterized protein YggE
MKKLFASAILISTFATFSLAAFGSTSSIDAGFISVNASASQDVSPNQAEISFSVESSDKSMQKASADNKLASQKVYSALKALISKDDYIKTSNYSARPIYSYTKDNKRVLDKYVVTNTVTVKSKKTDLVSRFIDSAIANGATNVENLQFTASQYDDVCNKALSDLTKKAYSQASTIASSINSGITGIKTINASCTPENQPRPFYGMMMAKSPEMDNSSTPIESGKLKINVNVDATFYVK